MTFYLFKIFLAIYFQDFLWGIHELFKMSFASGHFDFLMVKVLEVIQVKGILHIYVSIYRTAKQSPGSANPDFYKDDSFSWFPASLDKKN
jgi:hypothetical protein